MMRRSINSLVEMSLLHLQIRTDWM